MQTTMSHRLAVRGGLALSSLIAFTLSACASRDLRPLNPCTVSASSEVLNVLPVEDIDLLFVVDNSGSMAEEQAALQAQIGVIVETLITQSIIDGLIASNPALTGAKAVKRLRVGTISTDLGVAGFGQNETTATIEANIGPGLRDIVVPFCGPTFSPTFELLDFSPEETRTGDRGVINLEPVETTIGSITCPTSFPSFLFFDVDANDQTEVEFAEDVSCATVLGTGGCGFEMQLEAMLKAVTPSTSTAVEFAAVHGTGVADLAYPEGNAGFFREEAILAIIMITDEDDCSTANPLLFDPQAAEFDDPSAPALTALGPEPYRNNTRCTTFEDALYPIERYVDGLLAAKPASKLVFAAITGVPGDAVSEATGADGRQDIDMILARPEMQVTDHASASLPSEWLPLPAQLAGDYVVPACWRCIPDDTVTNFADCPATVGEEFQFAVPGRRIAEFAQGLQEEGVISVVHTVCTDDYGPAITNILEQILLVAKPSCLNRALNPNAEGAVPCNFLETLPAGQTCADLADQGREETPYKIEEDGRETCRLIQQIPTEADRTAGTSPEGLGWFYDNYTAATLSDCAGREVLAKVRFTDATTPTSGGTVRIDCLQPAQAEKDINTPCADDTACQFGDEDGLSAFVVRWNLDAQRFSVGGEQPMSCDANTNTCQIDCTNDSECPGGMVCSEEDGNVCLDPTCNIR